MAVVGRGRHSCARPTTSVPTLVIVGGVVEGLEVPGRPKDEDELELLGDAVISGLQLLSELRDVKVVLVTSALLLRLAPLSVISHYQKLREINYRKLIPLL